MGGRYVFFKNMTFPCYVCVSDKELTDVDDSYHRHILLNNNDHIYIVTQTWLSLTLLFFLLTYISRHVIYRSRAELGTG